MARSKRSARQRHEPETPQFAAAVNDDADDFPVASNGDENGHSDAAEKGRQMGALPEWWTQSYPQVTSVEAATAYLDGLGGDISRKEQGSRMVLWTADQVLYEADTDEELDGFVLGFALSQLIAARHGPIALVRQAQQQAAAQADAAPVSAEADAAPVSAEGDLAPSAADPEAPTT